MSYMDRVILHSDLNACYANIELLYAPQFAGRPLVVCGDEENRHGIVLSKTAETKPYGIKTGMSLFEARRLCPELVEVPPNFTRYVNYSRAVSAIYLRYTDRCEPFGIDESWLDLTGCVTVKDGESAAHDIRRAVKNELGLTVSVGVSWNKVFAKLGSDYKKPDAVTVINRENHKRLVWPLPVSELIMVGPKTTKKLAALGIYTIGELACADESLLKLRLGKHGEMVHRYARGADNAPVLRKAEQPREKSIGNGTTCPRDIHSLQEAIPTLMSLAESVGARLRKANFLANTFTLDIKDKNLFTRSHGRRLHLPTHSTQDIFDIALDLLREAHTWNVPLRALSLRAEQLESSLLPEQLNMFCDQERSDARRSLDRAMDNIRSKYGKASVLRGSVFETPDMALPLGQEEYSFLRR